MTATNCDVVTRAAARRSIFTGRHPSPLFCKIHLSKDLAPLFALFPNFVRNMLYSENSKYRHLVYYYLVITPIFAFRATSRVSSSHGLSIPRRKFPTHTFPHPHILPCYDELPAESRVVPSLAVEKVPLANALCRPPQADYVASSSS